MTIEEANKVFDDWRKYIEVADKMHTIFSLVPMSFLPYPVRILEEALNMVAEERFKAGDTKMAKSIQELMTAHLMGYFLTSKDGSVSHTEEFPSDLEVLRRMRKELELTLDNPDLLEIKLENLKRCFNSWLELKDR